MIHQIRIYGAAAPGTRTLFTSAEMALPLSGILAKRGIVRDHG